MISRLVELEQARLAKLGFETSVENTTLLIENKEELFNLGNDSYILTGILVSDNDRQGAKSVIKIQSPTGCFDGTQLRLAEKGVATYMTMREYISILSGDGLPYELQFVRISPYNKQ